jgi:hypothetical protein
LHDALSQYIKAVRKIGGRRRSGVLTTTRHAPGHRRETLKSIREWAKKNGHHVNNRDRLPADVVQAWGETAVCRWRCSLVIASEKSSRCHGCSTPRAWAAGDHVYGGLVDHAITVLAQRMGQRGLPAPGAPVKT